MNVFWIAVTLFIVMDSFGGIPIFIALLKGVPPERQYRVIIREMIIAYIIIIIFNFVGGPLLEFLQIQEHAVSIAGGVVLFILGLRMVFPTGHEEEDLKKLQEPFIVPLAVPVIAGPAVLATVMLFARQEISDLVMISAITMAWIGSLIVLLISPLVTKKLGDKGIIAIERLMGLVLLLMAVQMSMSGIKAFFNIQG
jgi:multiple antibiotic resistance protein